GDEDFEISASSSSNLPVEFKTMTPLVCAIQANKLHILRAGIAVITASQPGNGNWLSGESITQSFTIAKADQVISFPNVPAKKLGDPDFELFATASSGGPITFSSSDPSIASIVGNVVKLHRPGEISLSASQVGNENFNPFVNSQPLVVLLTTAIEGGRDDSYLIYPNPARDLITITGTTSRDIIYVIDPIGRILIQQQGQENKVEIDIQPLRNGIYTIRLKSGSGEVWRRILKR
ncbi:MAG: T9SS type A sorting domain-containing protein, partial [Bacteroidota bacterium]